MTHSVTEALAYYDSWLAFNQRYQRVPGVQVAVYAEDAIAFSAAYGLADVENDVPLTDQHLFRIASHSKTFTGTAIFQLVEQGRLRLDDKVSQHVTEIVGTSVGERTVRELLAHAGGLTRDSLDANWWQLVLGLPGSRPAARRTAGRVVGRDRGERALQVLEHRLRPARTRRRGGERYAVQLVCPDRDRGQARAVGSRPGAGPGPAERVRRRVQRADVRRHPRPDRARRHPRAGLGDRVLRQRARPGDVLLRASARRQPAALGQVQARDAAPAVDDRVGRRRRGTASAWR